jgi:hypothetical protein
MQCPVAPTWQAPGPGHGCPAHAHAPHDLVSLPSFREILPAPHRSEEVPAATARAALRVMAAYGMAPAAGVTGEAAAGRAAAAGHRNAEETVAA